MRSPIWFSRGPFHRRPPAELDGVLAVVFAACLFLCLCTTQVPATETPSQESEIVTAQDRPTMLGLGERGREEHHRVRVRLAVRRPN